MRKKLRFEVEWFRHKWPVFGFGFLAGGTEFIVALWIVEFRLAWTY